MIPGELESAARLFPFDREYRRAPAQFIIRENVWEQPSYAITQLEAAKKFDPNSKYIEEWIVEFERREQFAATIPKCTDCDLHYAGIGWFNPSFGSSDDLIPYMHKETTNG